MEKLALDGGTPVRTKGFPSWPVWGDDEINNLVEVVKSGQWGSLKGKKTPEFERRFADYHQVKHGICVNSGTTALRLALTAVGVRPGDEVLVPGYTFIASATAVLDAGAIPIFVDIDPNTYNIDLEKIEASISSKTTAIMPVHFAGRAVNMDRLMAIAQKHHLLVVEDAAQAWGSEWNGHCVSSQGNAGCFSFQSSKNINAGEGGIILTNDDLTAKMARSHSNCGRSEDGAWYEHFYFGGNYRMTEFQSAILLAQLDRYADLWAIRCENSDYLDQQLANIPGLCLLPNDKQNTKNSRHLYIFRFIGQEFGGQKKDWFINALRKEGIPASPGYSLPVYSQPVFRNKAFGPRGETIELPVDYKQVQLTEADRACYEEAVWLTQNVLLGTKEDMDDIITAISKVRGAVS